MSAGSFVGFATVFVLVCTATSAMIAVALRIAGTRGAAVGRRAAELAAAIPVALALGVVAILVVESLLAYDHCGTHGHHAHLCLAHGAEWLQRGGAVALVAASSVGFLARAAVLGAALVRGRAIAARLRGAAVLAGDVHLVDSDRAFSFVAGVRRPIVIASTGARRALDEDEWRAMLAHERGHAAHRDLRARVALDVLLLFAAPLAGLAVRARWELATEQLRDAEAARVVGAEAVASALVRMARHAGPHAAHVLPAFTPRAACVLDARVRALLEPPPPRERAARLLARALWLAVTASLAAAALWSDSLHHALETLLG